MARFNGLLLFVLLGLLGLGEVYGKNVHLHKRDDKHWVDIWATMPQLTEIANLPPVPYVRQNLYGDLMKCDV